MNAIENVHVAAVFERYPPHMREKLLFLRQLILDAASESEGAGAVEETLKWGEPSYIVANGSTIRIDWKKAAPRQYAMYFNCKTKLVDTFKEIYRDIFQYEGNRAIVFQENEQIPINELKHCISTSLLYHAKKHLPHIGM
ncbi:MAG: DUF1801 domain-containing protein [Paenibacillaceae bacterium]|nr:DUF1801 domain-containing protein [Paenibacillaceae bacterium]